MIGVSIVKFPYILQIYSNQTVFNHNYIIYTHLLVDLFFHVNTN